MTNAYDHVAAEAAEHEEALADRRFAAWLRCHAWPQVTDPGPSGVQFLPDTGQVPWITPATPPPTPAWVSKPGGWAFTKHAKLRGIEMGLTLDDLIRIVMTAEVDYVQNYTDPTTGAARPGQRVAKRGDHSVVYDPAQHLLITVLFNTQEQYVRPEKLVR